MNLNNLFRYSHPMLSNYERFKDQGACCVSCLAVSAAPMRVVTPGCGVVAEIVVPGGLVLASALAASARYLHLGCGYHGADTFLGCWLGLHRRSLYEVLHEQVDHCSFLHKAHRRCRSLDSSCHLLSCCWLLRVD
jgi:hypothetical protein